MVKRLFDLAVSALGVVLLAPLFLLAAVLTRLDSPGPVFYRGERVGLRGRPFRMLKFRTMVAGADRMGPALTHAADNRVTRTGRVLRKWKIDELPQLVNVMRGEMSLVGPRPESPRYARHYTSEQRKVLEVRPGITGLAQVKYRNEEAMLRRCVDLEGDYIAEIMPRKLELDLEYVRRRSLSFDLALIGQTFECLFQTEGEPPSLRDPGR